MRHTLPALALTALVSLTCQVTSHAQPAVHKPNILLILADDLGFSDIGCYGGEVHTPNLDKLADRGLSYTQFYNTTRCWPSRAAILTGYYAQQVRRDRMPNSRGPIFSVRPSWAHLIPYYLAAGGYRSYHDGKWHMDGIPMNQGFDHSYYIHDTTNYFSPRLQFDDSVPIKVPAAGFYATKSIADHAIAHLTDHVRNYSGRPFFEYLAFTAPHFPLQALPEDIARYQHRFDAGWDVLRAQRLDRMKRIGILNCELSARTPGVPAWNAISEKEKYKWSTRMSIHAAMVDRMDQEIGRVLAQLRKMNVLDNTAIFFMSDNGASAEVGPREPQDSNPTPGSEQSFVCLEPGLANLANTPLRLSKIFVHEGGISTPMIVNWPAGMRSRGELRKNPGHLIDMMPTILEIAGVPGPAPSNSGRYVPAPPGRSLVPSFDKDNTVSHDYLWWFHSNNRAIRIGDWKIVAEGPDTPWELYNMQADRSEMHNLAAVYPDKVSELAKVWQAHTDEFRLAATSEGPPEILHMPGYTQLRKPPRIPRARRAVAF